MIIAVTGFLGSGKTSAARVFKQKGFQYINVDSIGHELLRLESVKKKLMKEFGKNIFVGKRICRRRLGRVVLGDSKLLKKYSRMIHPMLEKEVNKRSGKKKNIVLDVALLKELKLEKKADVVVLVKASKKDIYKRLEKRYTKKQVDNIMKNQKIVKKFDYCILNNSSLRELRNKTLKVFEKIK